MSYRSKWTVIAIIVGASLLLAGASAAFQGVPDTPAPRVPRAEFMQRKLEHAQGLVAELSSGDLKGVSQHADKLGLLCLDEQWNVLGSPEYLERSATLRRTIAELSRAAREEKLERAELAFLDLVGQCFSCHNYVRDDRQKR